ncbi:MAG: putative sodium/hydrogen antiporter [Anaerolineaceae bacterium]|nr:MAG: putative sodium/hydrogen antiporter [Anaerolineaceae bacterium]
MLTKKTMINFVIVSPFLQLAFLLVIILLAAKLAGYVSIRLGQPSVLGELLVGILLGPSLINLLHLPILSNEASGEFIHQLGEIGVLLLMFIAGLELHFSEMRHSLRVSALAGILGVIFPFALGWGTGLLFGLDQTAAIFLGLTLGATSVSISAQTLIELNVLRSRVGLSLLGAAVFDDILVILLLSIFFALSSGAGSVADIAIVFGRMALFFALAAAFGLWALPRLVRWVRELPVSQNVLTLAIVTLLGYALAAELIGGMAAITGAFLAGLMFARSPEREALEPRISALAYGFFVPIFFVSIGLSVDIASIKAGLGLAAVVIIVAILGKLLGSGLGAKWAGFSWREAWQLGAGMVSRGEVGLIVASVGMQAGLVNEAEFAAIVGMVIVSTLVTPPVLRALFKEPKVLEMKDEPKENIV